MTLLYSASLQHGRANVAASLAISLNAVLIPPPRVFKLLLNGSVLKPQEYCVKNSSHKTAH